MDRRVFMKSGAMALVTMGLSPSFLRRTAFGAELLKGTALNGAARGKTLICLFQRGAADALNVVVPHGDPAYYRLRPNIAIPRPAITAGPVGAAGPAADRLEALYRTGTADVVHAAGGEMFEAVKILKSANPQKYLPQNNATYPNSQFGQRLKQIAQLIKSDIGLEVAFADVGGWDTHVNQGGSTGQLAARLDDFSQSIGALVTDLGDRMNDVVILTMSEFGRTARQNGNGGTDHGHASALVV